MLTLTLVVAVQAGVQASEWSGWRRHDEHRAQVHGLVAFELVAPSPHMRVSFETWNLHEHELPHDLQMGRGHQVEGDVSGEDEVRPMRSLARL